jgi:hypothetical protein
MGSLAVSSGRPTGFSNCFGLQIDGTSFIEVITGYGLPTGLADVSPLGEVRSHACPSRCGHSQLARDRQN